MINKKINEGWYTSVGAIILAFIFFWPVGIVLLYLRSIEKIGKYKVVSNTLLWCGIALAGFGILVMGTSAEAEDFVSTVIIFFILCVLPGIILIGKGIKRKIKLKYYQKYLQCIGFKKKVSINYLSEKREIDKETVINDISDMIHKKIISGYINDYDELILDGYLEYAEKMKKHEKLTKVIKCEECGAQNSIVSGETSECEYCGTILQG